MPELTAMSSTLQFVELLVRMDVGALTLRNFTLAVIAFSS